MTALLEARQISRSIAQSRGFLRPKLRVPVLNGLSVRLRAGEILGIHGAAGAGKSVLAAVLLGQDRDGEGSVLLQGQPLEALPLAERARQLQPFYHGQGARLPDLPCADVIALPLHVQGGVRPCDRDRQVRMIADRLALPRRVLEAHPADLPPDQRQRVVLARALITAPLALICDEPVAGPDPQIFAILQMLRRDDGLAVVILSRDAAVAGAIADRSLVLQSGVLTGAASGA